ncbi:MAG: DUF4192 domain-containing protein [Nocardioides sp.]
MTRTVHAQTPTDLLAMVPFLLGFHPERSIVLLTLGEAGTPVHARQDLPAADDLAADVGRLVADLVTVARRARLRRAALVAYTDAPGLAAAVARPLARALTDAGVDVPVCVRTDGRRWHCLAEDDPGDEGGCGGACPGEGTPYDLARHPLTLEAVVQGRVVMPSRDALRDTLNGDDPDEIARVAVAAERAGDTLMAVCRGPGGESDPVRGRAFMVQEGRWVQHRLSAFLRDRDRLESQEVGRLLVALAAIEVRDVAWALLDHDNAGQHVDLWRDVLRRSPLETQAAPAALLAFAAWLAGDGALAWCAVDRSQEAEPGYSLAGLVAQALAGAVPPHQWQPLGPDALTLFAG